MKDNKTKPGTPTTRIININQPNSKRSSTNYIQTAKYTFYNFLPLAIINQFRNYFNFFFLCMIIIFSIKIISPVDPKSAYIPFLVIFCISICREGYEDFKKQQYDYAYNNLLSNEYNYNEKTFEPIKWKNISIGNVIKVNKNEVIPADLLLLKSSNENGFAYMQTANLDGETALKPREAITYCQNSIVTEMDIEREIRGTFEEDMPNKNIYTIDGCLNLLNTEKIYFNVSNCLLRNAILKNANYVYGLVIYTGKETKIMQNINKGSFKGSIIDVLLNKIVIVLIIIVFLGAIILTGIGMSFHVKNFPTKTDFLMDYVFKMRKDEQTVGMTLEVIRTFASFFNILSTLIPISIMVSLELCKTIQTIVLSQDANYRLGEDEKTKYLSMKLHENLGAIKYIFTDKTGTLTKNEMEFKGCSIFTKLFSQYEDNKGLSNLETYCSSYKQKTIFSKDFNPMMLREALITNQRLFLVNEEDSKYNSTLRDITIEFFSNIALNHNVLVFSEEEGQGEGKLDREEEGKDALKSNCNYSGSNPDEVVLVQAAKEIGIEFVDRIGSQCQLKIFNRINKYELLQRFEFTSARKRSSVIIRDSSGTIKLYMKGADNVILKKINSFSKEYIEAATKEHISQFSKEGLRTLCYSMKILTEEEYTNWLVKYLLMQKEALQDKSLAPQLDQIIAELEDNMTLLGVTGLEDLLQDEVKDSIKDFIDAEINVWMLTGDKLDTAQSIGYGCKLLNDDTEVFKISEKHSTQTGFLLNKIKREMGQTSKAKQSQMILLSHMPELKKKHKSANVYGYNNSQCNKRRNISETYFPVKDPYSNFKLDTLENKSPRLLLPNDDLMVSPPQLGAPAEIPDDAEILKYVIQNNIINNESQPEVSLTFVKQMKKKEDTLNQRDSKIRKSIHMDILESEMKNRLKKLDESEQQLTAKKEFKPQDPVQSLGDNNNNNVKYMNQEISQEKTNKDNDKGDLSMRNFALIIEGESISECLKKENQKLFYECIVNCRSIICSRCSPGQKAEVVNFIKKQCNHLTLAIGDGGNDVNMIQSAHIGVGIFGKEGSQAAYSSDFAFSQFKYLRRLLFVHGRYSIHRNSYFVYFYFFKNIMFTFIQFWFILFNGVSGTLFYDDLYSLGYNSFITTILPCTYSIFEEDIDTTFEKHPKKEMAKLLLPELYKEMRDMVPFSIQKFLISIATGFFFSLLLFFLPYLGFMGNIAYRAGKVDSFADQSLSTYMALVVFVYVIQITDTYYFNTWVVAIYLIQFGISIVFMFIQNILENHLVSEKFFDITSNSRFWAITILSFGLCYTLIYIYRIFERFFSNSLRNRMRNDLILLDLKKNLYRKKVIETRKYSRFVERFKKIYNKKTYEPENYVDKKLKECVDDFKSILNGRVSAQKPMSKYKE